MIAAPALFHDPDAPCQADQYADEFGRLLDIYRLVAPFRVLEIGVRGGGSLCQWIKHAPPGAHVVGVDLPTGRWGWPRADEGAAQQWQALATARGVALTLIWGDSHTPATWEQVRKLGPFDWLFIDGDHHETGVRADYEAYGRLVRSAGVIALHDILPNADDPEIQVWPLWQALAAAGGRALVSAPGQTARGIGVVVK